MLFCSLNYHIATLCMYIHTSMHIYWLWSISAYWVMALWAMLTEALHFNTSINAKILILRIHMFSFPLLHWLPKCKQALSFKKQFLATLFLLCMCSALNSSMSQLPFMMQAKTTLLSIHLKDVIYTIDELQPCHPLHRTRSQPSLDYYVNQK